MENLIAITYEHDLPQLEVFLYCLNKNWKGNQHLTLIVNSNSLGDNSQDIQYASGVVESVFSTDWEVNVCNGAMAHKDGYIEQAINKILFSVNSGFEDSIVFDTKDLILKEMSLSDFKNETGYRAAYIDTSARHKDLYPHVAYMFDTVPDLPPTQHLTPWIWNNQQLKLTWDYLNERFGNYQDWPEKYTYNFLPTGTEWDSYFAYTSVTNNIFQPFNELIFSAGIWTHQTYDGAVEQALEFKKSSHKKLWKHSRKINDERIFDVTKDILLHYAIPKDIVNRWYDYGKSLMKDVYA